MDVVRKQVQKLRGRIDVISKPGEGTTFLLKLPLTLAIIDGLVVGVGDQRYIVPMFAVREMLQPAEDAISTIHGRQEMALVRGTLLPVIRLHQKFQVTAAAPTSLGEPADRVRERKQTVLPDGGRVDRQAGGGDQEPGRRHAQHRRESRAAPFWVTDAWG